MQGSGACWPLKCWSEDGNPASHGTVQLRLRKPSNAPPRSRIGGYGSVLRPGPIILRRILACRKSTGESGGIQAPGACGPGLQGAWGPGPPLGPFPHKNHPNLFKSPTTPPPPPPAFWGCKGERKRVFTLSAFGNHPTRPPRSADITAPNI